MTIYSKLILILVLLLFAAESLVYPAAKQNSKMYIVGDYEPGNILGFTQYLVSTGEYYRAFVELKRLNSYYPGYIKKDNYFTTELFLLFKGGVYPDILKAKFDYNSDNIKAIHSIFITDLYIKKNEFLKVEALINSGTDTGNNKDIEFYLYKRTLLLYLLLNKIDETRRIIDNRKTDYINNLNDNDFRESIELTESCFASFKNPYNAAALGAVPGMGYVYADKTSTGIIAFVLISALSAFTYYSFKTDNKPIGVFAGTAATFFYGGSIIGGYLSAKKYNVAAMNDLNDSLSRRMNLEEDRENIYNNYGIGNIGK